MSSGGDVVVYQGIDPMAADFTLVGRYYVGKPLGRRCMCRYGSDLLILTAEGLIPMSRLLGLRDGGSPVEVRPTDDLESVAVVMPMRL